MSAEAILKLKNHVNGKFDPDSERPNFLKVVLDANSVGMLERVVRVHEAAAEIYGASRVRHIELDFPAPSLEYIQHHLSGPKTWSGNFSMPSVVLHSDGIQFVAAPFGANVTFESELVTYDRLGRELRKWRAHEMGQTIDEAMPDDDAPAMEKTSGMSPL